MDRHHHRYTGDGSGKDGGEHFKILHKKACEPSPCNLKSAVEKRRKVACMPCHVFLPSGAWKQERCILRVPLDWRCTVTA